MEDYESSEIIDVSFDLEKIGSVVGKEFVFYAPKPTTFRNERNIRKQKVQTAVMEGILTWQRATVISILFAALTFIDPELISFRPMLQEHESITPVVRTVLAILIAMYSISFITSESGLDWSKVLHYLAGFLMGFCVYMLINHLMWPLSVRGLIVSFFSFASLRIAARIVGELLFP